MAGRERTVVLVTGMSGLIGGALRRHLDPARYELRSLSRRAVEGVPSHQADIGDLDAIQPAFAGVDVVVHLAAAVGSPPFEALLHTNVIGTYNVFEAARRAKVSRVIFASSGATVSASLGRHYADAYGLSVICVRVGRVRAEDRPKDPREFAVWLSQRDTARMVERCLAAPPTVRFDILFVTSRNRSGYRDLDHARAVVGFEPVDAAEDHRV